MHVSKVLYLNENNCEPMQVEFAGQVKIVVLFHPY